MAGAAARLSGCSGAGVPTRVQLYPRVDHVTPLGAMGQPLRWLAPVRAEVITFLGFDAGR